jgi:hypothetical protein
MARDQQRDRAVANSITRHASIYNLRHILDLLLSINSEGCREEAAGQATVLVRRRLPVLHHTMHDHVKDGL